MGNEVQLLDAVIESLKPLEKGLQGETYTAVYLWDQPKYKDHKNQQDIYICRPKDEKALSDYVKLHFEQDLNQWVVNAHISVKREVEIRCRQGQGGSAGEIPDMRITAVNLDNGEAFSVLVETKGCWNDEVNTAIEHQLVRYLTDNNVSKCGLYLVGWFNCPQWDEEDESRKSQAERLDRSQGGLVGLQQHLNNQAVQFSNEVQQIRAYVINVALR